MRTDQGHLLVSRRFLPLFLTQFLGAANDNLYKNAILILILFRLAGPAGMNGPVVVTVGAALFIAPFFIFSALAGQLADKYEKARLIRAIKVAEIVIMGLGVLAFWARSAHGLLLILFLMGAQSTFFGPLKYSILPDHLAPEELVSGNALVEAGTFLAILAGTIAGGLLVLGPHGIAVICTGIITLAVLGWLASRFIPPAGPADPSLRVDPWLVPEIGRVVAHAGRRRVVIASILAISWFWLLGATFLAQFPAFAKVTFGANEQVVTLFLATFTIGIGAGSALCGRLLKGRITGRFAPLALVLISAFSLDLVMAATGGRPSAGPLLGAAAFLAEPRHWRVLFDLVMVAASAGIYVVPLYAMLQNRSESSHVSRMVAANNILNAVFMAISGVLASLALAAGFSVPQIFLATAVANLGAAALLVRLP